MKKNKIKTKGIAVLASILCITSVASFGNIAFASEINSASVGSAKIQNDTNLFSVSPTVKTVLKDTVQLAFECTGLPGRVLASDLFGSLFDTGTDGREDPRYDKKDLEELKKFQAEQTQKILTSVDNLSAKIDSYQYTLKNDIEALLQGQKTAYFDTKYKDMRAITESTMISIEGQKYFLEDPTNTKRLLIAYNTIMDGVGELKLKEYREKLFAFRGDDSDDVNYFKDYAKQLLDTALNHIDDNKSADAVAVIKNELSTRFIQVSKYVGLINTLRHMQFVLKVQGLSPDSDEYNSEFKDLETYVDYNINALAVIAEKYKKAIDSIESVSFVTVSTSNGVTRYLSAPMAWSKTYDLIENGTEVTFSLSGNWIGDEQDGLKYDENLYNEGYLTGKREKYHGFNNSGGLEIKQNVKLKIDLNGHTIDVNKKDSEFLIYKDIPKAVDAPDSILEITSSAKKTVTDETTGETTTEPIYGTIKNGKGMNVTSNPWVSRAGVYINNINFTDFNGDVITVSHNGNLSVNNCIFKDIHDGAAINVKRAYNNRWPFSVANCKFENIDNSNGDGGAITIHQQEKDDDHDLNVFIGHIDDCEFTNCKAKNGGAIWNLGAKLYLNNCSFNDNFASECGGAIFAAQYSEINTSNFTDNYSNEEGFSLYFTSMSETSVVVSANGSKVDKCIFTDNQTSKSKVIHRDRDISVSITDCQHIKNACLGHSDNSIIAAKYCEKLHVIGNIIK